MATATEFDRWVKGEMYFCAASYGLIRQAGFEQNKFYPKDVIDTYYKENNSKRDSYDFCTYDEFINTDYLEVDTYEYTTPNGEVIKAVAKYGYDG